MTTTAQWHRIKWSFLSRLPADSPLETKFHMPFLQKTYSEGESLLDTGLHTSIIDDMQQEIKSLRANESHQASDTNALAIAENRNQDKLKIYATFDFTKL
ncbi:MAG: hypothetical protein ACRCUS_05075 [Anaerovoracaceae bacterium]